MNYYTNIAVASFQEGLQCNHLGYHCSSLGKQSKTTADGIGRVFADLLSIDVKGSSFTEMRLWG